MDWRQILEQQGWVFKSENCGCSGIKKVFFEKDEIKMVVYPKKDLYKYTLNGKPQAGKLSLLQPTV